MIDNVPFIVRDQITINKFLSNEALTIISSTESYDQKTGEIRERRIFKYRNLTFKFLFASNKQPFELRVSGSLHYFKNNGCHNADDFSYFEIVEILTNFQITFDINLKYLRLLPFEFGINFPIIYKPDYVVFNIFYEQRKLFTNNVGNIPSKISGNNNCDYSLKVYSKSDQFPNECPENTIRWEVKLRRTRVLKKYNIETVADLLKFETYKILKKVHLEYFQHLVLYDYTIKIPTKGKYKNFLDKYRIALNWKILIEEIKSGKGYETKYNDKVKLLNRASKLYGSNMLSNLLNLANLKWDELLIIPCVPSKFEIKKPKHAQKTKPKHAPYIMCIPTRCPETIF